MTRDNLDLGKTAGFAIPGPGNLYITTDATYSSIVRLQADDQIAHTVAVNFPAETRRYW